jgi:hypothetical protein
MRAFALLLLVPLLGCPPTEPGSEGEACNYDAITGEAGASLDGCDATTWCINAVCYRMCDDAADCSGGECVQWEYTYTDELVWACRNPRGG